jgi:phage repressor protein C with HTH and peptisase S24 domain
MEDSFVGLLCEPLDVTNVKATIEQLMRATNTRSAKELAEALGLKQHDIYNATSGKSEAAYGKVLDSARRVLGLPSEWPNEGRVVGLKPSGMARIRLIGTVSAGPGASDHPEEEDFWIPSRMYTGVEFGFLVEGDSLFPYVHPGDVLIAVPCKQPRYGYPMIVRHPDGSLAAKVIAWSNGRTVLRSTNRLEDAPADITYEGLVVGLYGYRSGVERAFQATAGLKLEDIIPGYISRTD